MESTHNTAVEVLNAIRNFYESETLRGLLLKLPTGALTETTFNRMLAHSSLKTGTAGFAIVSADRYDRVPFADPSAPTPYEINQANAANNKHRAGLEDLLSSLGLTFKRVRGGWYDKEKNIFSTENSYYVYDVDEEMATKLGKILTSQPFNQEAILYGVQGRGVFLLFGSGQVQRIGSTATPKIVDQGYTQLRKGSSKPLSGGLSTAHTPPVPAASRVFSFENQQFLGFLPELGSLSGLNAFNEVLKSVAFVETEPPKDADHFTEVFIGLAS